MKRPQCGDAPGPRNFLTSRIRLVSIACGREQSDNNRRAQLGIRRGQQLNLGGRLFLHILEPLLDAPEFALCPVHVEANVAEQFCIVRFHDMFVAPENKLVPVLRSALAVWLAATARDGKGKFYDIAVHGHHASSPSSSSASSSESASSMAISRTWSP